MMDTITAPPAKFKMLLSALSAGSQMVDELPMVTKGGKITRPAAAVLEDMLADGLIEITGLAIELTTAGYDVVKNWDRS